MARVKSGSLYMMWTVDNRNPTIHLSHGLHQFSLITTYHPGLNCLEQILRENFHFFSSQDLLTETPSVTFHMLPNLFQRIVNTIPCPDKSASSTNSSLVLSPIVKPAPIHLPVNSFISSFINFSYPITTYVECMSMNLIYQLRCIECDAFTLEKLNIKPHNIHP